MRHVAQRLGFQVPRGTIVLLLIAAALIGAAFWIGPFRPIPAELRLGVWGQRHDLPASLTNVGTEREPRFALVLALQNEGGRVAQPTAVHLSLPAYYRLQSNTVPLERESALGNPLVRYQLPVSERKVPPSGKAQPLLGADTVFLEPTISDYYCTTLDDSIPEFVPAPVMPPEQLARVQVYYSFEERHPAGRETGLMQLQLDPNVMRRTPAPMPPTFPVEMREPEMPRPELGDLVRAGTRTAFCGDPQQPLELYTVLWQTPGGGRFFVIYLNGAPRKQLFDLDRDSIIELEMWDPDADGRFEARRAARYPIPEFLLPERSEQTTANADSIAETPGWQELFVDTAAGPFRFLPDSLMPPRLKALQPEPPTPDTTIVPRAAVDTAFLRRFNNVEAGPFRFAEKPPPLRAKPPAPKPRGPRGPVPLGKPLPGYPPPPRPDTGTAH